MSSICRKFHGKKRRRSDYKLQITVMDVHFHFGKPFSLDKTKAVNVMSRSTEILINLHVLALHGPEFYSDPGHATEERLETDKQF